MSNRTEQSPFAIPSLPMMADGQKLLSATVGFQAQAFKAMMRYQIEMLSFLKHL